MIYFIHLHNVTSKLFKESHYWANGFAEGGTRDRYKTAFIFSGEAHGFGDLTDYDICFVQIGENDVKTAKDDPLGLNNQELMHAKINIVEKFHRQGVTT